MYFCAKAVRKIAGNVEQFCSTMHVSYIDTRFIQEGYLICMRLLRKVDTNMTMLW